MKNKNKGGEMHRHNDIFIEEKLRLLDESLRLIERLKKMRAIGARPRSIGIDPHILRVSGLDEANTEHIARIIKRVRLR